VGKPPVRSDFAALLANVKGRIQVAQTRAVLAVNAELVRLYWDVGQIIDARQKREGWGAGVIPAFYRQYSRQSEISPPAVAKLQSQKALQSAPALSDAAPMKNSTEVGAQIIAISSSTGLAARLRVEFG
jgi:hypothetical protein